MSSQDLEVYRDVIDVLDSIRCNVESYLDAMQEDDPQKSEQTVNSPCRLYIRENAPTVMRLSTLVQQLLQRVVEQEEQQQQHQGARSAGGGARSSASPTPEGARSEAVRALVTRKLGDVMENAHAMRTVVKQQQQQRLRPSSVPSLTRSAGGGSSSSSSSAGAAGHDLRMKQVVRVLTHDLEDTERLLRIAFPEDGASSGGPSASPAQPSTNAVSPLPPPPPLTSSSFTRRGDANDSPERPRDSTGSGYSASNTPRNSAGTAPYVRRSASLDTSSLPRQSSPSRASSNGTKTPASATTRVSALMGQPEDDDVLRSTDTSTASLLSASQRSAPAKATAPRVRFVLDHDDTSTSDLDDMDDDGYGEFDDDWEESEADRAEREGRLRASGGGLTSNRVQLRPSATNRVSAGESRNSSSSSRNGEVAASATNRAGVATVAPAASSTLVGVMQLAPFTGRRASTSTDGNDSSTTATTTATAASNNESSSTASVLPPERESALRRRDGRRPSSPATPRSSDSSLLAAGETAVYDPALHIIAHAEVPRGILKTSSSRLASAEGNHHTNNSNSESGSRISATSSPSTSRLMVQFADEVADYRSSSGAANNSSNENHSSNNNNTHNSMTSISSFGSTRPRVATLPPGLPPRSPRQPDSVGLPMLLPNPQLPPLAPSPSASAASSSSSHAPAAGPSRNVWVSSTHSQRLPGELWGRILETKKATMESVLRNDVIDLFNYGEEHPILRRDDVSDIRFNFVDAHLYMCFELEHQRSLSDSEINLRLGLCSYPLMTALYEDFFQEFQQDEFDPIESSSTSILTAPTSRRNSLQISSNAGTPTRRETTAERAESPPPRKEKQQQQRRVDPMRPLASPTPPPHSDGEKPTRNLSISAISDTPDSLAVSAVSEASRSSIATPHSTTAAATPAATGPTYASKKASSPLSPPAAAALAAVSQSAPTPDAGTAAAATAVRRTSASQATQDGASNGSVSTPTSPLVLAARKRGETHAALPQLSSASSTSSAASASRMQAHTLRLPGKHWETVTTHVPEDALKDAFLADLAVAVGVLPSEARQACQRVRFYLGSLVVKFRWSNGELFPGAVALSAADMDAKLKGYAFPTLRKVYADACVALHLVNDLTVEKEVEDGVRDSQDASLPTLPEAQFTLPMKAELDRSSSTSSSNNNNDSRSEVRQGEHSTSRDAAATPRVGEGAPTRSPSLSLNTPVSTSSKAAERRSAAAAPSKSASRSSPDPAPTPTGGPHTRSHSSNSTEETEPRETTPVPTQPIASVPSRGGSSQRQPSLLQRRSRSPIALAPPSLQPKQDVTLRGSSSSGSPITAAANAAAASSLKNHRESRSRSGSATAPRVPPTVALTDTAPTTTANRLARQHGVTLARLLALNPALAQHDPDALIPVPHALRVPCVPSPQPSARGATERAERETDSATHTETSSTVPTTTTAAVAAVETPQHSSAASSTMVSAEASSPNAASVVPRSISARRRSDVAAVVALRNRPRLTPKDGAAAAPPPPPPRPATSARLGGGGALQSDSVSRQRPQSATPPPALLPAETQHREVGERSNTAAEHRDQEGQRRGAGKQATSHAATRDAAPAASDPSLTEVAARRPPGAESQRQRDHQQHHREPEPTTPQQQPASGAALVRREASPRTPQAANASPALSVSQPDHIVYQLPTCPAPRVGLPAALAADRAFLDADPASVQRSARRQQHARPHLDTAGFSTGANRSANASATLPSHGSISRHANANAQPASEGTAGDSESASVTAVEHELGLRLHGLVVESVRRRGPAAEAGMQVGDVLRTLDGQPLTAEHELHRAAFAEPGPERERTLFVTGVSARGGPVTYRLRLPSAADATETPSGRGAAAGLLARKAGGSGLPLHLSSAAAGRHAQLLPPQPFRQPLRSQSARSARGTSAATTTSVAAESAGTSQPQHASHAPPPPATTRLLRGDAPATTATGRLRVSSVGAAARESNVRRSSSSRQALRETEAPTVVHVNPVGSSGGSVAAAVLSVRRTSRDSVPRTTARGVRDHEGS